MGKVGSNEFVKTVNKLLELVLVLGLLAFDCERIAVAVLLLEALNRAETLELASEHDAYLVAEGLALGHAVARDQYGHAEVSRLLDDVPQEPLGR